MFAGTGPTASDAALMRNAQAGDATAFAELYDRHRAAGYRVAHMICPGVSAAEDALQDGFVAAWRGRASYRPDRGKVRPWLMSVVRNRAIDTARRESLRTGRRTDLAPLAAAPAAVNVQADAIAATEAARMRRLVGGLPASQREVIALAFFGELTHAEIAAHLGLPPGTVKGRMRRGLRRLGEGLADVA